MLVSEHITELYIILTHHLSHTHNTHTYTHTHTHMHKHVNTHTVYYNGRRKCWRVCMCIS